MCCCFVCALCVVHCRARNRREQRARRSTAAAVGIGAGACSGHRSPARGIGASFHRDDGGRGRRSSVPTVVHYRPPPKKTGAPAAPSPVSAAGAVPDALALPCYCRRPRGELSAGAACGGCGGDMTDDDGDDGRSSIALTDDGLRASVRLSRDRAPTPAPPAAAGDDDAGTLPPRPPPPLAPRPAPSDSSPVSECAGLTGAAAGVGLRASASLTGLSDHHTQSSGRSPVSPDPPIMATDPPTGRTAGAERPLHGGAK
eukprot:gene20792-40315_t